MDLVFAVEDTSRRYYDDTARIYSFHYDGTAVKEWDSRGAGDGIAIHPILNWVFVTDSRNHQIQVFGIDGIFIFKWGSEGQGDGQFNHPCGVAVLARSQDRGYPTQDLVYVIDRDNHRVQVFTVEGVFIRKWGTRGDSQGEFDTPYGVAVHPSRDLVFISEMFGHRIQAFRSDGTFLFERGGSDDGYGFDYDHGSDYDPDSGFAGYDYTYYAGSGTDGDGNGQFSYPNHMTIHPTRDLLFVAESGNYRVQVLDLEGSFVCKWGAKGSADGEFSFPSGVAVHPTTDIVYVGDNQRIQAFSLFKNRHKRKRISEL